MGFFNKLIKRAEDVGEDVGGGGLGLLRRLADQRRRADDAQRFAAGAAASAGRSLFTRALRPAISTALKGASRAERLYFAGTKYAAQTTLGTYQNPETLIPVGFDRLGIGPSREERMRLWGETERNWEALPEWKKIPFQAAHDPLILTGAGGIAKAGLRGGFSAAGREAIVQTGLPSLVRAAWLPVNIVKGRKVSYLTQIGIGTSKVAEALKDRSAFKAEALTDLARGKLGQDAKSLSDLITGELNRVMGLPEKPASRLARLRLNLTMPHVKTLQDQYVALNENLGLLRGDEVVRSDILGQVRLGNPNALTNTLADARRELGIVAWRQPKATTLERAIMKVPYFNRILSGVEPGVRGAIEADPAKMVIMARAGTLEDAHRTGSSLFEGYMSVYTRSHKLIGDPITYKLPGTDVNVFKAVENPTKYLTPEQANVIEMGRNGLNATAEVAEKQLLAATEMSPARRQVAVAHIRDIQKPSYVPRVPVARSEGPGGVTRLRLPLAEGGERPSLMRRVAARVRIPTPVGPVQIPVGPRIGGTALPRTFKAVRPPSGRFGVKQAFEYDRVLATPEEASRTLFSTDPAVMFATKMREIEQIVVDETVVLPLLKSIGKSPNSIIGGMYDREISQGIRITNQIGRLRTILNSVASEGNVTPRTVSRLRQLAADAHIPEEVRVALEQRIFEAEAHLLAQEATGKAGGILARKLGKVGEKLEDITEAVTRQPFEPRGTQVPVRPIKQMEPTILRGQEAQELAAQAPELVADAKALRQNMVNGARTLRDEIDGGWLPAAREELRLARKEKLKAFKAATVFDLRQIPEIPGMSGTWFDNEVAAHLTDYFGAVKHDTVLKQLTALQGVVQSTVAGFDGSFTFMQALAAPFANPAGWAKALVYGLASMADERVYWAYMRNAMTSVDLASGKTLGEQIVAGRLGISGAEIFSPSVLTDTLRLSGDSLMARAGEYIARAPLNRAFTTGRNIASIEIFRSQVALEQAILGRGLTNPELEAVGRQADLATGVVSSAKLGIEPNQAAVERLFGRFGVQWFRSQTGRLVQAVAVGGIDGRVARRLLVQQLFAMTAAYMAAAKGLSQEINLDPSDRNFGTLLIGKSRVRFGGIYPSVMKTVADTVEAVANGDAKRLTDIRQGRNPILNFWRNGAPVLGGLIADTVVGVNSETQYRHTFGTAWQDVLPFSAQAALSPDLQDPSLLDRFIAGGASSLGLTESPQTATDIWAAVTEQYAREKGFTSWADIPTAQQEKIKNDIPEIAQADANRQAWFDKHGKQTPLDTYYQESGQSRAAMGDTLSALWARVQAGQMTKADWRTAYAEWSGRHAYFTENMLSGLPAADRAKLDKDAPLLQDRLASQFQAIQPQDLDGDSLIGEEDWDAWRTARDQWWKDHPEAAQYSNYILFEYPTRVWEKQDNPIMLAADTERRQVADRYDQYLSLPKYRGMSREDGEFLDQLISVKSAAARELGGMLAANGVDPSEISVPAKAAWKYALAILQQSGVAFDDHKAQLLKLAVAIDRKPEARLRLLSTQRFEFLRQHMEIMDWYPAAASATGIPTNYLIQLGLIAAPPGEGVAERAQAMLR